MKNRNEVILTHKQLELISLICHCYKDYHRGCTDEILEVMDFEKSLTNQTQGVYQADTTYDVKNKQ